MPFKKGNMPWNKGKKCPWPVNRKMDKKTKDKIRKKMKGNRNNWQGGRGKDNKRYTIIYMPSHPFAQKGGYVREHRLVMERHLGRYLKPEEKVHHRNGIRSDNRFKNLQLVVKTPHYGQIECPFCCKEFLIR